MTNIRDIIDMNELDRQVLAKNVRVQTHPDFPTLMIANYTEQAAFSRDWNDVTRMCRGLIWDDATGEVLARGFEKFFNWDEKEAPRILDDQVLYHWADKADGSLGIMYIPDRITGIPRIATRGSFASEQAALGTDILLNRMPHDGLVQYISMIDNGYTPLFEIVGPENRIVLRYPENVLVPLGYIHIGTGEFVAPAGAQPRTMRDLLGDLSRSNAEGWVAWLSNRKVVKVKQADYIALHRMVSNLTEKEVWRQLSAGTYDKYVKELPDELFAEAGAWADGLRDQFSVVYHQAFQLGEAVQHQRPPLESRKDKALWINKNVKSQFRGLVFALLDGKDIGPAIWRQLEPDGTPAWQRVTEGGNATKKPPASAEGNS